GRWRELRRVLSRCPTWSTRPRSASCCSPWSPWPRRTVSIRSKRCAIRRGGSAPRCRSRRQPRCPIGRVPDVTVSPDERFAALAHQTLDDLLGYQPTLATALGEHRHADRL